MFENKKIGQSAAKTLKLNKFIDFVPKIYYNYG